MTTRRLFVALFAIALFTMALRETIDPDMWWHLRTGEFILDHGLPRQDVFSFTVPENEWITHEWLSQLFMWTTFRLGGFSGLMIVFALVIAVTFWLVYAGSLGRPYLAAFVTLLAALASAVVWGARPQIFNLFFLAVFVNIVERYKDGKIHQQILWVIPLLTILWANLHSGYLLGIVLLAAYVVGESMQRWFGKEHGRTLEWPQIRQLTMSTAVAFLLAAVNPNGPELWLYPFSTLSSPAMQSFIQEWYSPDFHQAHFWPFGLMMALGIMAWVFSPGKPTLSELILFFGTAAAALLSARNIPLFAIVGAPIVSRHLWAGLRSTRLDRFQRSQHEVHSSSKKSIFLNSALLALAVGSAALWTTVKVTGNEAAITERYPVAAVDYLERTELASARGYNSYNWGGYLVWRQLPVFVDGRADVYGDDFLFYYRKSFDGAEDWQRPLDDFDVDYVLMERGSVLSVLLDVSQQWQEVYTDEIAQVFVRDSD